MMRTACVADCHVGNHAIHGGPTEAGLNRRCRLVLDTLRRAVVRADTLGCERFVVAGDLFDTVRPTPQMVSATIEALLVAQRRSSSMEIVVLLGNHDQVSTADGDNAIAVLRHAGIQVIESTEVRDEICYIPFQPGDARVWVPEALKAAKGCKVVITHVGIADDKTPAFLLDAKDALPLSLVLASLPEGVRAFAAGNWHGNRNWKETNPSRMVVQIGALCPADYGDDQVATGSLLLLNAQGVESMDRIPGPRFYSWVGYDPEGGELSRAASQWSHVRVTCAPEHMAARRQQLLELQATDPRLIDFDVRPDASAKEAVREASKRAAAVVGLEPALQGYLGRLPLPPAWVAYEGADELIKQVEHQTLVYLRKASPPPQGVAASLHLPAYLSLAGEGRSYCVQVPAKGLILVASPNGSGKSLSYVDLWGWALWGESRRAGKNILSPIGVASYLDDDETLTVQRTRTKRGVTLTCSLGTYESASKAQEALDRHLGPFDRWYRISVLSSLDASSFTLATDKVRKTLMEELVPDFNGFDAAVAAARKDLTVVGERLADEKRAQQVAETEHRYGTQRIADVLRTLAAVTVGDPSALQASSHQIHAQLEAGAAEIKRLQTQCEAARALLGQQREYAQRALGQAQAQYQLAHQQWSALTMPTALALQEAQPCHTCLRPADAGCIAHVLAAQEVIRQSAATQLAACEAQLRAAQAQLQAVRPPEELARLDVLLQSAQAQQQQLQQRRGELHQQQLQMQAQAQHRAQLQQEQKRLEADQTRFAAQIAAAQGRVAVLATEAEVLGQVAQVLGPKGLRAHLLQQALGALESLTNAHLASLWPGVTVSLPPPSEGKDTVELVLQGMNQGRPVADHPAKLSNGERRRLDIALFWARGDLLRAAWNMESPYEVYDEALDGLDVDGVRAVAQALAERAADRCVVVISHARDVFDGLPYTERRSL